MTNIYKSASEVPEWLEEDKSVQDFKGHISIAEADRIIAMPDELDENSIVEEMDIIEKCAAYKKDYHYNANWDETSVSKLKEYASICGLNKIIAVNKEDSNIRSYASNKAVIKTASAIKPSMSLQEAVGDTFGLSDLPKPDLTIDSGIRIRQEAKNRKENKENWEKNEPEQKLQSPNTLMTNASIIRLSGTDDYRTCQNLNVRRGQNSITNPKAIDEFAKSIDTGERLRVENKTRKEQIKAKNTSWQQEEVQKAKDLGAGSLPRGSVFMTECANAQPGLRDNISQKGVFQFNETESPDKTLGENLKNNNKDRKASIQRTKVSDKWEDLKGASRHEISDVFCDELEKKLQRK